MEEARNLSVAAAVDAEEAEVDSVVVVAVGVMTVEAIMETVEEVAAVDVVVVTEVAIANLKEREIGGVQAVTIQTSLGEISAIGKDIVFFFFINYFTQNTPYPSDAKHPKRVETPEVAVEDTQEEEMTVSRMIAAVAMEVMAVAGEAAVVVSIMTAVAEMVVVVAVDITVTETVVAVDVVVVAETGLAVEVAEAEEEVQCEETVAIGIGHIREISID